MRAISALTPEATAGGFPVARVEDPPPGPRDLKEEPRKYLPVAPNHTRDPRRTARWSSGLLDCGAVADLRWEELAKRSMHPLQVRILERGAATPDQRFSPVDLAAEFSEPLGNVS